MKTDLPPAPGSPPAKRRVLQDRNMTLNAWLHQWAADESLPPGARLKATEELERRKAEDRKTFVEVGVLVGPEGATPQQVTVFAEWWAKVGATRLEVGSAFPVASEDQRNLPKAPRLRDVVGDMPRTTHHARSEEEELKQVVVASSTIVALPPRISPTGTVWNAVGYAKHRKVPVTVILPNGTVQ